MATGFVPPQLLARREEVKSSAPSFSHVTAHSQKPKPKEARRGLTQELSSLRQLLGGCRRPHPQGALEDAFAAFLSSVEKQ